MNIKLRWLFAYLALFTVFLSLGAWQINRANEKQNFLTAEAQRVDVSVQLTPQTHDDANTLRYKSTTVVGRYDTTKQFLLDNQIDAGKAGYFVFTPFKLQNSSKAILVNRGWIPLIEPRATLPNVDFQAENELTLNGRINTFPSIGLKLEGANQPTKTNPAVVGIMDAQVLAAQLGYELFNVQLELPPSSPNGFKRDWAVAKIMQPEQHLAYALQWFGLAFVLTVIFIKLGLKKMTPQQRKNRQLIIGIFAMSIIPFGIAWFLAKNPQLLNPAATNKGQLITPAMPTERSDFQGFDTFSQENLKELEAHWLIVNVIPSANCNDVCLDALHKSQQIRLMLNKELVRTRRAVLILDSNVSQETGANWWKEDTDLLRLKPNAAVIEKLNGLYNGQIPEGTLLLVDPLGNFMMQYAPNFNPYDAKSDLMHLLKISQIG